MINLSLRQLRGFVAVAEELHFGRAASRLHIVQPALSMQIQNLEQMLGVRLLHRSSRLVELTEPGRIFLVEAYRMLLQADRSIEIARRAGRGEAGHLAIGYSGTVSHSGLLSRLIRAFRRDAPNVEFSFKEMYPALQREALLQREIDLGLIATPESEAPAVLAVKTLGSWQLRLALSSGHPLGDFDAIPLERLAAEKFISNATLGDDLILDVLRRAGGFTPTVAYEADSPAMLLSLVAAELGVALVLEGMLQNNLPGVMFRPIAADLLPVPVSVLYRSDSEKPALRRFLETLSQVQSSIL